MDSGHVDSHRHVVIAIDIDLSLLDAAARESPDVEFIEGDLFHVEKCFPGDFLKVN